MSKRRMTNKEFIEDRRLALQESNEHFSSAHKPERERWVVLEFLSNFNMPFEEVDIKSSSSEPPDVIYGDCLFEIKEILDPGRRRHDEFRQKYEKALQAKHPRDLLEGYTPKDLSPAEIGNLVTEKLKEYENHYPRAVRKGLDILFYVNLMEHFHKPGPVPNADMFEPYGWRSVSVLEGWRSIILFAAYTAPELLRSNIGVVHNRKFD